MPMRLAYFIHSTNLLTFYYYNYKLKFLYNQAGKGGELTLHETKIIAGALDLTQKTAKDAMTPLSETFSLDINSKLDMYISHICYLLYSKLHFC